ncbi:DUF6283 family protein [Microbulbifer epialgicus]|uniref:DUF6283 family protein n=1 Tax=Microbulbifer epialgicus TaxID=393907 RepID=A0ABV4NU98_9GAMM
MKKKGRVVRVRPAGHDHQVVSVEGVSGKYMKKPCGDCPWKKDSVGIFPSEAFRLSAPTSYDMAKEEFSCHCAGVDSPKTCAGFLLKGADHNLSVRLARMRGEIKDDIQDGGVDLFDSYREMAIANGVDPDDECLKESRED